jgi:exosortase A-associated hydrolase 2
MPEIREDIFFFPGSGGRKLLGFLHEPAENGKSVGIVYSHPFAEEKNCSHAIVVKTARELARNGYTVFRFDYSGCGDSEGDLTEVTIDDWRNDLRHAVLYLKTRTPISEIGYWGLRTGAGLAFLQAHQQQDAHILMLWQPIFDFKTYMHQFLRQRLSAEIAALGDNKVSVDSLIAEIRSQDFVEVVGYTLSQQLYDSFTALGNLNFTQAPNCPTQLVSISGTSTPSFTLKKIAEWMNLVTTAFDFTHVQIEPFWDRYWRWEAPELINATLAWLEQCEVIVLS